MLEMLLVEDNARLRQALKQGLAATGTLRVAHDCDSGEAALAYCLATPPQVILFDVQLAGAMSGIDAAVAIRREYPRLPVVLYSIQDDDAYYRAFRRSGILQPLCLCAQVQLPAAADDRAVAARRGGGTELHRSGHRGARAGSAS